MCQLLYISSTYHLFENVKKMNKSDLIKLEFEEDKDLPELFKRSLDKSPMGHARFEILRNGKRIGKLYWDEIRFVWDYYDYKGKPFLEIKTLHGFNMNIFQNEYVIWLPIEKTEDACYLRYIPIHFDTISFYLEFELDIKINGLRKH